MCLACADARPRHNAVLRGSDAARCLASRETARHAPATRRQETALGLAAEYQADAERAAGGGAELPALHRRDQALAEVVAAVLAEADVGDAAVAIDRERD